MCVEAARDGCFLETGIPDKYKGSLSNACGLAHNSVKP